MRRGKNYDRNQKHVVKMATPKTVVSLRWYEEGKPRTWDRKLPKKKKECFRLFEFRWKTKLNLICRLSTRTWTELDMGSNPARIRLTVWSLSSYHF